MRQLLGILLFGFTLATSAADYTKDGNWHRITTKTEVGHKLTINYKIIKERYLSNKPTVVYYADPMFITLDSKELDKSDRVRIVFTSKMDDDGYLRTETSKEIDLSWDGEHFSGQLNQTAIEIPIAVRGYSFTTKYIQEIAVVINGDWQKFKNDTSFVFSLKNKSRNQEWGW